MKRTFTVLCVFLMMASLAFAGGAKEKEEEAAPAADVALKEAPMLAALVKAGKLPPLEERLPDEPVVVEPVDSLGEYGGTLRLFMTTGNSSAYCRCTGYEDAFRWSPKTDFGNVLPNVVRSYEVNSDFTEFTFHFLKGLKWSDGHPFTTEDIAYYWETCMFTDEFKKTARLGSKIRAGGEYGELKVIDDYTVKIKFTVPYGSFIQAMACINTFFWAPKHHLKQFHPLYTDPAKLAKMAKDEGYENWYKMYAVKGNHRYIPNFPVLYPWINMTDMRDETKIHVVRNPYYWKVDPQGRQYPYIDEVTFDQVGSTDVAVINTLNGEYDFIDYNINVMDKYPVFAENKDKGNYHFVKHVSACMNVAVVQFNHTHPDSDKRAVFNTPAFKKAMSYAINREEINQLVYAGRSVPRQCSPSDESAFYDASYAKAYVEYDTAKANKLLDEAGLDKKDSEGFRLMPNGKRLELLIETSNDYHPEYPDVCDLLAKYYNAVGVKTAYKIQSNIGGYAKRMNSGDFDIGIWHGDGGMEVLFEQRYYVPTRGCWSAWGLQWHHWFNNPEKGMEPPQIIKDMKAWYDQVKATGDLNEMKALMKKITSAHKENMWVIGTVTWPEGFAIINNRLQNVPDWFWRSWMYPNPAPINMFTLYFKD